MLLLVRAALLLIAFPAAAHVFPYTLAGAYGPNGALDSTLRACTPGAGCYTRSGGLCSDDPAATCDLQVVPEGRCAEGDAASGNLWPDGAGRCHDDPALACLADPPHAAASAQSCLASRSSCLHESRMCADVPDSTADAHPIGLCDMSANDPSAACSRDPGSASFEVEVCGGGPARARCSDGDLPGPADGGLGSAQCSETGHAGPGSSFASCGPLAGTPFPDAGRSELESPRGPAALLLREPGSVGTAFAGAIRSPRTSLALGIEAGSGDEYGVRHMILYGPSFWAEPDYALENLDGAVLGRSEATQPCVIPPGWEPGLPVSGRCRSASGAETAIACFRDEGCAEVGGTCSIDLRFCREPGAVRDGFGLLWTRELAPAERTGTCPPDCGFELDQTAFEREELARIGELDPAAGTQALLESFSGERASAGDAVIVRPWSTPVLVDPPGDPRCHIGGDPDPLANPLRWQGRCTHGAFACDPATGDAEPEEAGVQLCSELAPGSDCHVCARDPFYDAHALEELELAGRVGWIESGALPGTRVVAAYALPALLVDTNGRQSLEFRDPLGGGTDRNGLGPVEGGSAGIALASGRTRFEAGEALAFRPGATAALEIEIRPPDPGVPLGPLVRAGDRGPGPDGVPGCFASADPVDPAGACSDPAFGNSGADDVIRLVSIAGGPPVPGVEGRWKARSANPAAVDFFSSGYGYAAPDPPTLSTWNLLAARDLSPHPDLPGARDVIDRTGLSWCPLVDGSPECTLGCVPGQPGDLDCDSVPDAEDNCPHHASRDQTDRDGNGRGDACECGDQDGDGTLSVEDLVAMNRAIFEPESTSVLCDASGDGLCDVRDVLALNVDLFSPGLTSVCPRQPVPGP